MAVVIDDLPPLMWHAELGRSLEDVWTGTHHRGVQLHNLHEAVRTWHDRYGQQAWLRQLQADITPDMEDALLRTIARLDGTPFPSTPKLATRWARGRARNRASLETLFCAEVVAATFTEMGLLEPSRPENWYDPGRFWSGDKLPLIPGAELGAEIAVVIPPLPGSDDTDTKEGQRRRRDAAQQWWRENGPRALNERLVRGLRAVPEPEALRPPWTGAGD